MIVFLLFTVTAVPPQTTVTTTIPSLTIVYPKYDVMLFGGNDVYTVDILNSTYAKLDNTSTSCAWYMANISGMLEGSGDLIYDSTNKFWYFNVPEISTTGDYGIYVYCSNAAEAGFISEVLSFKYSSSDPVIYIGLVIVLGMLIFAIFMIGIGLKDDHAPLKLFMYWMGILMFIPLANVGLAIAEAESMAASIITMAGLFSYITVFMGIFASAYFMIYLLTKLLMTASEVAKNKLRKA